MYTTTSSSLPGLTFYDVYVLSSNIIINGLCAVHDEEASEKWICDEKLLLFQAVFNTQMGN